jgi:diguanylate cyclase (GGDEF)-like protein
MASRILDLYTLSIILILISSMLSVVMLVAWRANKTYAGFGWWTAGNLIGAIGFLSVGLRGLVPDVLTVVVGNMLSITSLLIINHGIRVFFAKPARVRFVVSMLLTQLVTTTYFFAVDNNVVMRIVCVSLCAALISAVCAYEFLSVHSNARRLIHTFASAAYICFSTFLIGRAVLTYTVSKLDDLYAPDWVQSLAFVMFNLFVVVWTFTFMVLNSQRLQEELENARIELEKLATTDYLTGLSNMRAFFERASNEIIRGQRHEIPLSVVVFDIDHFKRVNDRFGHPGGDKMLRQMAAVCKRMTRQNDIVARLGGEEFGLLLTHTDLGTARFVAESFRKAIAELVVGAGNGSISITASFGAAELKDTDTLESFLARADQNLYQAKDRGRNCVVADSAEISNRPQLIINNIVPVFPRTDPSAQGRV